MLIHRDSGCAKIECFCFDFAIHFDVGYRGHSQSLRLRCEAITSILICELAGSLTGQFIYQFLLSLMFNNHFCLHSSHFCSQV